MLRLLRPRRTSPFLKEVLRRRLGGTDPIHTEHGEGGRPPPGAGLGARRRARGPNHATATGFPGPGTATAERTLTLTDPALLLRRRGARCPDTASGCWEGTEVRRTRGTCPGAWKGSGSSSGSGRTPCPAPVTVLGRRGPGPLPRPGRALPGSQGAAVKCHRQPRADRALLGRGPGGGGRRGRHSLSLHSPWPRGTAPLPAATAGASLQPSPRSQPTGSPCRGPHAAPAPVLGWPLSRGHGRQPGPIPDTAGRSRAAGPVGVGVHTPVCPAVPRAGLTASGPIRSAAPCGGSSSGIGCRWSSRQSRCAWER